jgi:hypothetical protein
MKTRLFLAAALASSSALASGPAPTLDVMGLTMGAKLSIAECAAKKQMGRLAYESEYSSSKNMVRPCYQVRAGYTDTPGASIASGVVKVRLLLGDAVPKGITWNRIDAVLIDGELHHLRVPTTGISSQEDLLQQLTDKYATPLDITRETLQTRAGASFEAAYATWKFDDLMVVFIGMAGSIDNGGISFATPKGEAHDSAEAAAKKAAAPRL